MSFFDEKCNCNCNRNCNICNGGMATRELNGCGCAIMTPRNLSRTLKTGGKNVKIDK